MTGFTARLNPGYTQAQHDAALTWSCDICRAGVDELCTNAVTGTPLTDRALHFGRLHDRRRTR